MNPTSVEAKLREILYTEGASDLQRVSALVGMVRPATASDTKAANASFKEIVDALTKDSSLGTTLSEIILRIADSYHLQKFFTECGIVSTKSFWSDFFAKANRKFLPEYYPEDDIRHLIREVFHRATDYIWLSALSDETWEQLCNVIKTTDKSDSTIYSNPSYLLESIQILAQRITAIAYEPEIDSKLPDIEDISSPYVDLTRGAILFIKAIKANEQSELVRTRGEELMQLITQCRQGVEQIYENKDQYGVDMHFVYLIKRLEQQINRLQLLADVVLTRGTRQESTSIHRLLAHLLKAEKQQNSIQKHIHSNLQLLLYKIAVNTSKVGEHYKVASRMEYFIMLKSALGGGLIVGLLACLKIGISYLPFSPLGTALGYSINYAMGFVAIYMLHFTLATKQPAMTASTIAKTLADGDSTNVITNETRLLIRQIARSQIVSLVGNVAASLPFAWLLTKLFTLALGSHIATPAKSIALMDDINPWLSLSLYYAAVAGIYLMISGLIAGYYDNLILHNSFYLRLKSHYRLRKILGQRRLDKLSLYLSNNLGNIAGNIFLGVFLGVTSTIGHFIGIPIDIRHVTFSAANFGIALAEYPGLIPANMLAGVAIGIFGIGLVNVFVSFGLSIAIALYSHGANPSEYVRLLKDILKDFLKAPHLYIFPAKDRKLTEAKKDPQQ